MFKKTTLGLVAGALAFGLTAASAAVTSFTINSVQNTGSTDIAAATVTTSPCTGAYDITWTIDQAGAVSGGQATRTAPIGTDSNLPFCANAPAGLRILDSSNTQLAVVYGTTDSKGDFSFTSWYDTLNASNPILTSGYKVELAIGPMVSML